MKKHIFFVIVLGLIMGFFYPSFSLAVGSPYGCPALVSTVTLTGSHSYSVVVSGNYAYVADYTNSSIDVVDISTPASASVVHTISLSGQPVSQVISGNYLYASNWNGTVSVVDISTPSSASEIHTVTLTGNNAVSVAVNGNYLYVDMNDKGSTSDGLSVVDITTPSSASEIASVTLTGTYNSTVSVAISSNYAYVANLNDNTISVVNISTPASASEVHTISLSSGNVVWLTALNSYLYASSTDSTLHVVDISTPLSASEVRIVSLTGSNPTFDTVSGHYVFVANSNDSSLSIVNISNPLSASEVALVNVDPTFYASPSSVAVSGSHAYIADTSTNNMFVVDFSCLVAIPATHTLTPTAGKNGSISPAGATTVDDGVNQTFVISANAPYTTNVIVDGASQGPLTTYTFANVTTDHTIIADFSLVLGGGGGASSGAPTFTTSSTSDSSSQAVETPTPPPTTPSTPGVVAPTRAEVITQIKQQLVALITQLIQILTEEAAAMGR
ncbi:MAG: hypothetical protein NT155_04775 [Candidatus Staskawiczbacteria bacterium]|nr:hypothetical protein [Candidatus Staskawiczbacteria bacterium]